MANSWTKTVGATGSAAVIAATVVFLPNWEGMDKVAKRDMIGTGHPITYCYGQTDEFGAVKAGTRFTKQECDQKLAESLPRYLDKVGPCVHVPVPVKTMAALLDASYNAGASAVCKSSMVSRINAGDIRGGCEAFKGWYVRSDGQIRKGLVARRSGIGDGRKSERDLCIEGLNEAKGDWYLHDAGRVKSAPATKDPKPLSRAEFKADPYACFGAGRYDAMRDGRKCPVEKAWWRK
jgi:lysozyme